MNWLLPALVALYHTLAFSPSPQLALLGAGSVGGALYSVTFNCIGSNGTNISSIDSNWTQLAGKGAVTIQSNNCYLGTAGEMSYAYSGVSFHNDQYSRFTLSSIANIGDIGPAVRVSSSVDTSYWCSIQNSPTAGGLYKRVSGSQTTLGTFTHTWAIGDVFNLSVTGTTLTCTVNGTTMASATDSSISSGSAGLWGYEVSAAPFTAAVTMGNVD